MSSNKSSKSDTIIQLLNYAFTQLRNYAITQLLNYSITQLLNYSLTQLLNGIQSRPGGLREALTRKVLLNKTIVLVNFCQEPPGANIIAQEPPGVARSTHEPRKVVLSG